LNVDIPSLILEGAQRVGLDLIPEYLRQDHMVVQVHYDWREYTDGQLSITFEINVPRADPLFDHMLGSNSTVIDPSYGYYLSSSARFTVDRMPASARLILRSWLDEEEMGLLRSLGLMQARTIKVYDVSCSV
jgi:hypothetical protein